MPSGGGGDYARWNGFYQDKSTDVIIATGTTAIANAIAVKSANHQLFIQKITLSITGHAVSTYTFDDDGSGPAIAVHTDAATEAETTPNFKSVVVWDFGPKGYGLTVGANLDITKTSSGTAVVHIEAYEKLAVPMAVGPNN